MVLNAAANRLAISATEGSARGVVAGGEPACGELVEPAGPADGVAAVRDVGEARGPRTGGSLDGAEAAAAAGAEAAPGGAAAAGVADAKSGGRPATGSS